MSDAANIDVPEEFDEWPFDARRFVLAEANTAADLRREIDALAGMSSDGWEQDQPLRLTKDQAAALLMALGGAQGDDP
jgi:hypothetical protein